MLQNAAATVMITTTTAQDCLSDPFRLAIAKATLSGSSTPPSTSNYDNDPCRLFDDNESACRANSSPQCWWLVTSETQFEPNCNFDVISVPLGKRQAFYFSSASNKTCLQPNANDQVQCDGFDSSTKDLFYWFHLKPLGKAAKLRIDIDFGIANVGAKIFPIVSHQPFRLGSCVPSAPHTPENYYYFNHAAVETFQADPNQEYAILAAGNVEGGLPYNRRWIRVVEATGRAVCESDCQQEDQDDFLETFPEETCTCRDVVNKTNARGHAIAAIATRTSNCDRCLTDEPNCEVTPCLDYVLNQTICVRYGGERFYDKNGDRLGDRYGVRLTRDLEGFTQCQGEGSLIDSGGQVVFLSHEERCVIEWKPMTTIVIPISAKALRRLCSTTQAL